MKHAKAIIILCMVMIFGYAQQAKAELIASSGPEQVALIEVYSSEGCSSCVPAWRWLNQAQGHSRLWYGFVPVDFHVDYWDNLGWKDKLDKKRFSNRQRSYAAAWGSQRVYTPGFVLNGKEWRGWGDPTALARLNGGEAGHLSVDKIYPNVYRVRFEPAVSVKTDQGFQAHVALLIFDLKSDILAGENAGCQVEHDFSVVEYQEAPMKSVSQGVFQVDIPASFPVEYDQVKKGIAAWVNQQGRIYSVQAAGGYLEG